MVVAVRVTHNSLGIEMEMEKFGDLEEEDKNNNSRSIA